MFRGSLGNNEPHYFSVEFENPVKKVCLFFEAGLWFLYCCEVAGLNGQRHYYGLSFAEVEGRA